MKVSLWTSGYAKFAQLAALRYVDCDRHRKVDQMKRTISRIAVATAAISMALSPVAAHANTRAGDSGVVIAMQSGTTSDPWIIGDDEGAGFWLDSRGVLAIVLGAFAITGMIVVVSDGDNQSPGAN